MAQAYPEPPERLFDAQINVPATLAANAASFEGNRAYRAYLQRWSQFYGTKLHANGHVAIGTVAQFLEGPESGELQLGEGTSSGGGDNSAFLKRAKLIADLFGPQKGRGQNVSENNSVKGVANRTIPLQKATLYVLNEWIDENQLGPKTKASWEQVRQEWKSEGVSEATRNRREGRMLHEMLLNLPVFVMRNGGVYYSSTMLRWALGWENHSYQLFRLLRDANRSGRLSREEPREVNPEEWAQLWAGEVSNRAVGEELGGKVQEPHLVGGGGRAEDEAGTSATAAGQPEGTEIVPIGAYSDLGSILLGLGSEDRTDTDLAKMAMGVALASNIPVHENLYRAEHQLAAVGWDTTAFRGACIELLAKAVDAPPTISEAAFAERGRRLVAFKANAKAQLKAGSGALAEAQEREEQGRAGGTETQKGPLDAKVPRKKRTPRERKGKEAETETNTETKGKGKVTEGTEEKGGEVARKLKGKAKAEESEDSKAGEEGGEAGRKRKGKAKAEESEDVKAGEEGGEAVRKLKGKAKAEESEQKAGEEGGEAARKKGKGMARKSKAKAGEERAEEVGRESGSEDEGESESEVESEWLDDDIRFDPQAPVPIKALGEMSRFHEDFAIPEQAVQMQSGYSVEFQSKYGGRSNLWDFTVLSKVLPCSVPVPTSQHEVFFSEALVRAAVVGMEPQNRSLTMAALNVSEGAPLKDAALSNMTTGVLTRVVRAKRLAGALVAEDEWAPPEASAGENEWRQRDLGARRRVFMNAVNSGERAGFEAGALHCDDKKRRRIVPEKID